METSPTIKSSLIKYLHTQQHCYMKKKIQKPYFNMEIILTVKRPNLAFIVEK